VAQLYHSEMRPVHDAYGRMIGYERAITARPTAETRAQSGYVPDSDVLQRYAHMSALLKRVEALSRTASCVMALLYGDLGQRWAPEAPHGRLGALYHLTAKGQQLIKDDARKTKQNGAAIDLTAPARMWNIAGAKQPNAERAQALSYCATQAKALELDARAVWFSVKQRNSARAAA